MSAPEYKDVTKEAEDLKTTSKPGVTAVAPNNSPARYHLEPNSDIALDPAHTHHHAHLHHSARAMEGQVDDVVYSKGTTNEPSTIPHQAPLDHALHRRHHPADDKGNVDVTDAEKGAISPIQSEEDPQTHTFSKFYAKYRIFFHLFIWLLFSGYVQVLHLYKSQLCHVTCQDAVSAPTSSISCSETINCGLLANICFEDGGSQVSFSTATIWDGSSPSSSIYASPFA